MEAVQLRFNWYADCSLHEVSQPIISVSHDLNAFAGLGSLRTQYALQLLLPPTRGTANEGEPVPELAIAFESTRCNLHLPGRIPPPVANVSVIDADKQSAHDRAPVSTFVDRRELITLNLPTRGDSMPPNSHASRSPGRKAKDLHDSRCLPIGHCCTELRE